ncbi:hypothetical protein IWW55_000769 [Coemansia sp. RSA 2706]|nr:hypothetical protein IWW55_000769 [Coemansia sp. RSA 2706]
MDSLRSKGGPVERWQEVQKDSLGKLDALDHDGLCAIYHTLRSQATPDQASSLDSAAIAAYPELESIAADFEKELQLKQHLAILLDTKTLPTAQMELIAALWKTQPYVRAVTKAE